MAGTLDRKYVEEHLGAHDYESFGRSRMLCAQRRRRSGAARNREAQTWRGPEVGASSPGRGIGM